MSLPVLPRSHELVTPDAAATIERELAEAVVLLDDIDIAQEWLARADALAAYLSHKDAQGPMLGAMRRIEARIGELLWEKGRGGRGKTVPHTEQFSRKADLTEFRKLAGKVRRGLLRYEDNGADSPWRASRAALLLHGSDRPDGDSTKSNEWYTPAKYLDSARTVLGKIDLDPASSEEANARVGAQRYYSADGLTHTWKGRVWLNPPYGGASGEFTAKLVAEFDTGNVTAAVLLVNANSTDTAWFRPLFSHTLCFTDHRIDFDTPEGIEKTSTSSHGSVFVYFGPDPHKFASEFGRFGNVVRRWP